MTKRRVTAFVALGVVVAAGVAAAVVASTGRSVDAPPSEGTVIVTSASSKAAEAASHTPVGTPEREAAQYLSQQPTAVWLTPEADPVVKVPERIAGLAREAREQDARIAVVVYGLPGRDCGGHSSGGLDEARYSEWTAAIGDALRAAADASPIVILEPDSLALAPECSNVRDRTRQLSEAIETLAAPTTWIYVDGGHSDWLAAAEMARLIAGLPTESIRGFATNVSNDNATADEIAYAHEVSAHLDGLHAVIDTSRNGAGGHDDWCNPPGRLVGEPGGAIGDDVVDTNLWIKPPGESDGECGGGPPAGTWWPHAAVELTRGRTDVGTK